MILRSLCALMLLLTASVAFAAAPPNVSIVPVVETLDLDSIGVTNAGDGSNRLFIVEQTGIVRIWTGSSLLVTPFLDIGSLITGGGEQGLLGLAFHPDYEVNGFFYVNYTDLSGDTVVDRYTVSAGDANVADPMTRMQVLTFDQPFTNHNAGDMHFGPDGFLYIASGDGGGDWCNSQDNTNLLGKILRIDVDNDDFPGDPDANYAIPGDNPLVGVSGAREEIWSLGLRNPWRFSFDRLTGDMYIGDVGEGDWEEFSVEPATSAGGENYGWPWFEGNATFETCSNPPGSITSCDDVGMTCPILTLSRDDGNCSAIGGFRYRSSVFSGLNGYYFYTDWCGSGTIWAAETDGTSWTAHNVGAVGGFGPTGFGEGEDGTLYVVNRETLFQITGGSLFADGFESGDTTSWTLP